MGSSVIQVLIETFSFSMLVSFLTLGISAASFEGAVLYPLRLWAYNKWAKKQYIVLQHLKDYQSHRRTLRQASEWVVPAIELAQIRILYRIWWCKMLFMCSQCMPTLWSAVIFWTVFYNQPVYIWLLGWPISSALNYIISKKVL